MEQGKIINSERLVNFLVFYLEAEIEGMGEEEELEVIYQKLEESGIDAESSEHDALELIAAAKIEAKKERGKKFKEEYYNLLKSSKESKRQIENEMPELALAFRKLEGSSNINDVLDDEVKMKLLEYLQKNKMKPVQHEDKQEKNKS